MRPQQYSNTFNTHFCTSIAKITTTCRQVGVIKGTGQQDKAKGSPASNGLSISGVALSNTEIETKKTSNEATLAADGGLPKTVTKQKESKEIPTESVTATTDISKKATSKSAITPEYVELALKAAATATAAGAGAAAEQGDAKSKGTGKAKAVAKEKATLLLCYLFLNFCDYFSFYLCLSTYLPLSLSISQTPPPTIPTNATIFCASILNIQHFRTSRHTNERGRHAKVAR